MPGFSVHHQLLELAQTHVHQISDAIQPSHPLLYPSPPAFNHAQHQSLSQWFDLPTVQGTLRSLLHHSSKASILQLSAFFFFFFN